MARIDKDHVIELVGKVVAGPQVVDRLAHRPVLGRGHDLALHEAPGGVFGIGQRLLDRGPLGQRQRVEKRLLLGLLEILDQVARLVRRAVADHHEAGAAACDLGLRVAQLRDLLTAEQSTEVPEEDQQRRPTCQHVAQGAQCRLGPLDFECQGLYSDLVVHLTPYTRPAPWSDAARWAELSGLNLEPNGVLAPLR